MLLGADVEQNEAVERRDILGIEDGFVVQFATHRGCRNDLGIPVEFARFYFKTGPKPKRSGSDVGQVISEGNIVLD